MTKVTLAPGALLNQSLSIGQIYQHKSGDVYIVGIADGGKLNLINLGYGTRWSHNGFNGSESEFTRVTGAVTITPSK